MISLTNKINEILILLFLLSIYLTGSIESEVRSVTAVPGEEFDFDIKIVNNFDHFQTLSLSYYSPENFEGRFMLDSKEVKEIYLKSNESKDVVFHLEVPEKIEEGEYLIWVSAGNSQTIRVNIKKPENILSITPKLTGIKTEAGETVRIPISIENKINAKVDVKLSCDVPENWTYKFLSENTEVYGLLIESNEKIDVILEIETDSETEVGEYSIKSNFNEKALNTLIQITETHKGEKGKIKLKLIGKDGKAIDFAKLNAIGTSINEVYTSPEGEGILELEQGVYNIKIIKNGFYTKVIKDVEVKAGKTTDLGINLLERKLYFAEVVVNNPKLSHTIGSEKPVFKFRIENKGHMDDSYKLVLDLPDKFYYRFKENPESSISVSEIFIKSGESKEIYLEIILPYDVQIGKYNFTLFVDGTFGNIKRNLTLDLEGEYSLKVKPLNGRYLISTEPGKISEFEILLENTGKGVSITNNVIETEKPTNWELIAEPWEIPEIQPGESKIILIKVLVPPDTIPSEYEIKIKVNCDQIGAEEEFRVIVKEKTYSPLVGILIISFSIFGLSMVLKKYGRR